MLHSGCLRVKEAHTLRSVGVEAEAIQDPVVDQSTATYHLVAAVGLQKAT